MSSPHRIVIMFTIVILIFFKLSFVLLHDSDNDNCPYNDERNKYTEGSNRWQHYFDSISKANKEFELSADCWSESCDPCSACHDRVRAEDLAPFSGGITRSMVEQAEAVSRVTKYQIINGKLYRSEDCMFPFRCTGIEHFLLKLLNENKIPDTEFVVNTRDWPQLHRAVTRDPVPVFSFSKTAQYLDIMYPVWAFWCGGPAISLYPRGLGRWDEHRESLGQAAETWPWEEKLDLAMFRGSRTSAERDPLVILSRQCPSIVDAQYTKNQAWKSSKDTLGMKPAQEISLESHCQYKYLFNYRGVAASFRFKHLFLCRSLVFHVGDEWLEFFYPAMRPWIHYIPVPKDADMEELYNLIEFAKEHPDISKKIADSGATFIKENLTMRDVECYWRDLLRQYTELLTYTVVRDPKLKLVKSSPS